MTSVTIPRSVANGKREEISQDRVEYVLSSMINGSGVTVKEQCKVAASACPRMVQKGQIWGLRCKGAVKV